MLALETLFEILALDAAFHFVRSFSDADAVVLLHVLWPHIYPDGPLKFSFLCLTL